MMSVHSPCVVSLFEREWGVLIKEIFLHLLLSSWFFFSMEKNLFLSQRRPFLLHEKKQHEPSYKHCEGELNSPYSSASHSKNCQVSCWLQ